LPELERRGAQAPVIAKRADIFYDADQYPDNHNREQYFLEQPEDYFEDEQEEAPACEMHK
jgi:hypothetical protein